ncbi:MAG: cadherin-like beta sandwich domain-containing protein [Agathobacter sp.]|nr:cadherin-like beta sandwich domain-containing protein [Agathobacter sp.]
MKKSVSLLLSITLFLAVLFVPNMTVKAENVTLSLSASSINIGDSVTATVSVPSGYAATVLLNWSGNVEGGGNSATYNIGDAAGQPNSASVTLKATGEGTIAITAEVLFAGDADANEVTMGGASATVTVANAVSEPQTPSGGDGGDGGSSEPALSGDNSLSSLIISPGKLSPAFKSGTKSYTARVANDVTSIAVSAKPTNANATVTAVSGNTDLEVGENTVTITVKAENGVTSKYTIIVTRVNEGELVDEDETGETNEEDAVFEVNGVKMTPSQEIDEESLPDDFSLSTIFLGNVEYACAIFDKGDLVLLNLEAEDGELGGFYVYDKDQNAVYPFVKLQSEMGYIIVLMPAVEGIPTGMVEKSLAIEGKGIVTAYQKEAAEEENSAFYLLYAINHNGEEKWYEYDAEEGTFLRYIEEVETVEEELVENNDPELEKQIKELENRNRIMMLVGIFIIVLFLIIIVNLLLFYRKKDDDEEDEDSELEENESEEDLEEKDKDESSKIDLVDLEFEEITLEDEIYDEEESTDEGVEDDDDEVEVEFYEMEPEVEDDDDEVEVEFYEMEPEVEDDDEIEVEFYEMEPENVVEESKEEIKEEFADSDEIDPEAILAAALAQLEEEFEDDESDKKKDDSDDIEFLDL